jgi:hydrogenase nickel incorporation protein HypA/HybF
MELIMAEAIKQNATPIEAKISCGTFDGVNDEILTFAFEAISRETVCEGMKLEIEHKPIKGKCKKCQCVFDFEITSPECTKCGGDFDLLPEQPLLLETIEFETE